MKKLTSFKKTVMLLAVAFISVATSCKKDKEPMLADQNIVQTVSANDNFSLLEATVVHADLVSTLSGNGPFTVFVPTMRLLLLPGLTLKLNYCLTKRNLT